MAITGIDWEAGERHFVTQTGPRITIRQYSSMTADLHWTGNQAIPYDNLRQYAKMSNWLKKRSEYLMEKHPGIVMDAEILYGLVILAMICLATWGVTSLDKLGMI